MATSFFQLKLQGWWVAVIAMTFRIASAVLTYARADLLHALSRLGRSQAQIDALRTNPVLRSSAILWWSVATSVAYFIFLCWLRRYFRPVTPLHYTETNSLSNSMQAGS